MLKQWRSDNMRSWLSIIIGAIFLVVLYIAQSNSKPATPIARPSPTPVAPGPKAASVPEIKAPTPVPLDNPPSGQVIKKNGLSLVAPFEINTSAGQNYLVKLVDANTKQDAIMVFVRGGDTVKVKAPLGTYILRYASGDGWYGYRTKAHFGPSTTCTQADTLLAFARTYNGYDGHSVTLYKVRNGNLSTSNIPVDQF